MNTWKRLAQKKHWLKKAVEYGIPTDGREDQAMKDAEARYRREYRQRKTEEAGKCPLNLREGKHSDK